MEEQKNQREEINSIVIERLKMGESIESIQYDLMSQGINLNKIVEEEKKEIESNTISHKKIEKMILQLKDKMLDEKYPSDEVRIGIKNT